MAAPVVWLERRSDGLTEWIEQARAEAALLAAEAAVSSEQQAQGRQVAALPAPLDERWCVARPSPAASAAAALVYSARPICNDPTVA